LLIDDYARASFIHSFIHCNLKIILCVLWNHCRVSVSRLAASCVSEAMCTGSHSSSFSRNCCSSCHQDFQFACTAVFVSFNI